MTENNKHDKQKSKKKHKFIAVIAIVFLLLFIGLAGYYLEKKLTPVEENQIENSQELDNSDKSVTDVEDKDSNVIDKDTEEKESNDNGKDIKDVEKGKKDKEIETKIQEKDIKETDTGDQERDTKESDTGDQERDSNDGIKKEPKEAITNSDDLSDSANDDLSNLEDLETKTRDDKIDKFMPKVNDKEKDSNIIDKDTEEKESNDNENGKDIKDDVEKGKKEKEIETKVQERDTKETDTDDQERDTKESDTGDQKTDSNDGIKKEPKEAITNSDDLSDNTDLSNGADDGASDELNKLENKEMTEPSILDRVLSILGLSENNFKEDLNILLVGLDNKENVSPGKIEADSIILSKLRPKLNNLKIENIDENKIYGNSSLKEYHNNNLVKAVEKISETKIDYYVYVNYQGFEKIIDELGGVQITLEKPINVPALGLNLKPSTNLLSGKEALNFIRWQGTDDLNRFKRQKILINSVMNKLKGNNILFNVKDLYNTIVESYNSIETDINPVLTAEIFNYLKDNKELELEFVD